MCAKVDRGSKAAQVAESPAGVRKAPDNSSLTRGTPIDCYLELSAHYKQVTDALENVLRWGTSVHVSENTMVDDVVVERLMDEDGCGRQVHLDRSKVLHPESQALSESDPFAPKRSPSVMAFLASAIRFILPPFTMQHLPMYQYQISAIPCPSPCHQPATSIVEQQSALHLKT